MAEDINDVLMTSYMLMKYIKVPNRPYSKCFAAFVASTRPHPTFHNKESRWRTRIGVEDKWSESKLLQPLTTLSWSGSMKNQSRESTRTKCWSINSCLSFEPNQKNKKAR